MDCHQTASKISKQNRSAAVEPLEDDISDFLGDLACRRDIRST